MKHMSVSNVMTRDVLLLERLAKVGNIIELLECSLHNAFPVVVPGSRKLCGMVPRNVLMKLLDHGESYGAFQSHPDWHRTVPAQGTSQRRHCNYLGNGNLGRYAGTVPYGLLSKDSKGKSLDEIKSMLNDDERRMWIDLSPYVNNGAYHVPEHMTLR